jgi:hypothetical protein
MADFDTIEPIDDGEILYRRTSRSRAIPDTRRYPACGTRTASPGRRSNGGSCWRTACAYESKARFSRRHDPGDFLNHCNPAVETDTSHPAPACTTTLRLLETWRGHDVQASHVTARKERRRAAPSAGPRRRR